MSKEKKSLLNKLFKGSGGCNCGVQIVEERDEKTINKSDKKEIPNK